LQPTVIGIAAFFAFPDFQHDVLLSWLMFDEFA
jgi:hypothetical protein